MGAGNGMVAAHKVACFTTFLTLIPYWAKAKKAPHDSKGCMGFSKAV